MAKTDSRQPLFTQNGFYSNSLQQPSGIQISANKQKRSITISSMSKEAAMAMKQLTDPTSKTQQYSTTEPKSTKPNKNKLSKGAAKSRVKTAEHVCTVKLSNVYEKLGVGQKLEGDITDPATWEGQENQTKFVLGGGKMDNAMEIVEIVNADMPAPAAAAETDVDEQAIAEIARINSINKCNVWFEAHGALLDSNTQTDTMPALNIQSNGMPEH